MKFKKTLIEATLLQRYKRFFADIEYVEPGAKNKTKLTIHVPNTGSLKSVIEKPSNPQKCWFTLSDDPNRKLKGTLEAVQTAEGVWVGVNTSHPNKIVQEAATQSIEGKKPFFKHWSGFKFYKSEFKISKETRLDGVFYNHPDDLENIKSKKHYIEIKNTTLVRDHVAQFPDAVTERGQKHLMELTQLIKQGNSAELIFTVQRSDAKTFSVAEDIDPEYKRLFDLAVKAGLVITPVVVEVNQDEVVLTNKVLKVK